MLSAISFPVRSVSFFFLFWETCFSFSVLFLFLSEVEEAAEPPPAPEALTREDSVRHLFRCGLRERGFDMVRGVIEIVAEEFYSRNKITF